MTDDVAKLPGEIERALAESYGFTATRRPREPSPHWYNFYKGSVHLWYHGDWIRAELLDGQYQNHERYGTLEDALEQKNMKPWGWHRASQAEFHRQ